MAHRAVGPTARIYDWLEHHPDGAQWDALLAWVQAVSIDPEQVCHEMFYKPGTNRKVWLADIPVACTRAVFLVVDTPARAVHIIRLDDDQYVDRTDT